MGSGVDLYIMNSVINLIGLLKRIRELSCVYWVLEKDGKRGKWNNKDPIWSLKSYSAILLSSSIVFFVQRANHLFNSFLYISKCLERCGLVMCKTIGLRTICVNWCEMQVFYKWTLLFFIEGLASIKLMRDRQTNEPQGDYRYFSFLIYRVWIYWFCNRGRCY